MNYAQIPGRILRRCRDAFLDGWYFGDADSRSRACHLQYNYTANIIANYIGGNFYTGLMLYLNADDAFIGLMSIFVFSANCLQLLSPLVMEMFPKRKKILIFARLIIQFINIIFIGAIPFFPFGQQAKLVIFGASVLTINLINAIAAPGMTAWHLQSLPNQVRVKYFSLLQMTNGTIVATFNLIGGAVVDKFREANLELWGFEALRIFAALLLVYDIFLLTRIKETDYEKGEKINLKDLLIRPLKEKLYLRTVGIAVTWSMIANIPGSYYSVYLLRDLEISYSFLNIVSMLNVPILICLMPVWSRFLRKYSWLKTCNLSILLYACHYIILAMVNANNCMWLYPISQIYAFVLAVGINLSFSNIPYINIPKQNQTLYIGFYSTMTNLGALIGVTFGRELVTHTEELVVMGMGNKQLLVFVVGALMMIGSGLIFLLRRGVKEE